ncbi:MAG TPA: hypothetical protein VGF53_08090 [Pseudolabrys sp.]|jgi:hypothetical protein
MSFKFNQPYEFMRAVHLARDEAGNPHAPQLMRNWKNPVVPVSTGPDDDSLLAQPVENPPVTTDVEPTDYGWAPKFLRECGLSPADIDEFISAAKARGGVFSAMPTSEQAQDAARVAVNAAKFGARFPNTTRIGADDKLGTPIPTKHGRMMTQAETDRFNKRFPGASKIGNL